MTLNDLMGEQMISRTIRVALLVAVIFMAACSAKEETTFAVDTAEFFHRLERMGFAGAVRVSRGDQTLFHSGYEFADREAKTPWSENTISTMGSITKQFTGAAILLLQEDGLLSVDNLITAYFPNVPEDKKTIMLHQLLTHSSGIIELEGLGDWDPIELDTYIRRVMEQPLAFEPGSSFEYSNTGYSLLAAIIEQVSGGSYEAFMRERLFLPAGKENTGYIQADWDDAQVAIGYEADERWGTVLGRSIDEDGPYWALRGNGGIHSTTADMVKWSAALMSGAILSKQSMQAYWKPHVDEGYGDSFYSYGWVVMQGAAEKRVVTHNGGNNIFFADMAIYPDDDVTIVIQTNVVSDWPISNQLLEKIAERLFSGQPYPIIPEIEGTDLDVVASLTGHYVAGEGGDKLDFIVTSDGSELIISSGNALTFANLHSMRTVDAERCNRLSNRIAEIVAAYVEGNDLQPLFDAYNGAAPLKDLEDGWISRKDREEAEFGALTGFTILGTALRDGRDVTVARYLFENGHSETAFVWDPVEDEKLLGRSGRGLNPKLTFVSTGGSTFGSWDGGYTDSRSIRFDNGGESLTLINATENIVAVRDH